MNRSKWAVVVGPLAAVAVVVVFWIKIHGELAQGLPVFWLAELWPPAAVLSIILVVCIDLVVPPAHAAHPVPQASVSKTSQPKPKPRRKRSAA